MLFNKLSDNEKNMIEGYIRNNVYDTIGSMASLDHLLRFWNTNKASYLYKMMGENLILSKEILLKRDREEVIADIEEKCTAYRCDGYEFCTAFNGWIWDHYSCDSEEPFYTNTEYQREAKYALQCLTRADVLYDNVYHDLTIEIPYTDAAGVKKTFKLTDGMKVTRALSKIAEYFNLPGYEAFRIAHSQAVNEKICKGTLCMSIHPLDFMTASDNDCGWSSCMNWRDNGEYHRGTVEMMNSPCVVEVYLKATADMIIHHFDKDSKWSNKKWREFFIVDKNVISGIKGYPYWNRNLEAEGLAWIKELAAANLGWDNFSNSLFKFHAERYETVSDEFEEFGKSYGLDFDTYAMYNDFYGGNDYYAYLSTSCPESYRLCYSGESECMWCGSIYNDFDGESMICCNDCVDCQYCDCCGDRTSSDRLYEVDGYYYCQCCYDDLPVCEECGDVHTSNCMQRVYVAVDHEHISRRTIELCDNCIRKYTVYTAKKANKEGWWDDDEIQYILFDDLSDRVVNGYFYEDRQEMQRMWLEEIENGEFHGIAVQPRQEVLA